MAGTIGAFFEARAAQWKAADFLVVPSDPTRAYHPSGSIYSFAQASEIVMKWAACFENFGYGHGHRVAVLLENRPEMLLLKLALASRGISWVPVNPDYRPAEIAYLLQDSDAVLAIVAPNVAALMRDGILESGRDVPLVEMGVDLPDLPHAPGAAPVDGPVAPESEASLIYTSGTTGRPKGCIISHDYEIQMGKWYANLGGLVVFQEGKSRIYNPLPLFHVNGAILSFMCAIDQGCAQIIPARFSGSRWWREIVETRATVVHYLGIIIPALMNRPPEEYDSKHKIEFAVGAGVEPTLHRAFEERFGFPLIEVWGMSEMCRLLADCHEPRAVDTRAIGRPQKGLDVRVVDEKNIEVARGTPGEMVIRYDANTPRKGAFSGYLNLPEATEEAWRGGWFHTGDTVRMDKTGLIIFEDRKKNIIRRSGENIAAAEIEACLQEHPRVARVAVIAVPDTLRDEEVMACVEVIDGCDDALADELFDWSFKRLAYYKAPGWLRFLDEIPVTGTQKIQKHAMFGEGQNPTDGAYDFRDQKKRS
ncbi:AMP-binding protein [Shimia abyssi]|uniref:Crotonobetaine/carnitine-CoA ligase n=1 Tax=Shimia abyssi TaxID=1662395 RepID=A0A2P8F631_9RHOB|nr:AMP-binding protein [Shimia abyssi]PSL17180.1 crotonobetaine/carnitine-CoA ligase [Shimia abyssi]